MDENAQFVATKIAAIRGGMTTRAASYAAKRYERAWRLAMEKPFLSRYEIAKRVGCDLDFVDSVFADLKEFGYDRALEREILLDEFFEKRPNATNEDAAKRFGVPLWRILRARQGVEWDYKDEDDDDCEWGVNYPTDEELWERRAIRPEWYVEETCGAGYWGISLPPEEFKRYLEIRERKRRKGLPKLYFHQLPPVDDAEEVK